MVLDVYVRDNRRVFRRRHRSIEEKLDIAIKNKCYCNFKVNECSNVINRKGTTLKPPFQSISD